MRGSRCRDSRPVLMLAVVLLLACAAATGVGCGGDDGDDMPFTPPPEPAVTETALDVIAWSEAASAIGERLVVEGPVVSVSPPSGGEPAMLNVGLDAPDTSRFVVLIPKSVAAGLGAPVTEVYDSAFVRVTGVVTDRDGTAAIEVRDPKQIAVGM